MKIFFALAVSALVVSTIASAQQHEADRLRHSGEVLLEILGRLGLSFDAWLYHPQIGELAELARAFPETKIVLNHVGGPIGTGAYAGKHKEVFPGWAASIKAPESCSISSRTAIT